LEYLKNRVGISLRVEFIDRYKEKRDVLSQDWTNFLQKTNSIPIMIPNTLSDVTEFLNEMELNFIILSGGDNIGDFPERDKTEYEIINYAIKNNIAILGVCRGMQILNNFFGGSVITTSNQNHVGKPHPIDFTSSKFPELIEKKSLQVNSFHNNIIKKEGLGDNLETFALSKIDDTVEGYFHTNLPIIGIMWHPERSNHIELESFLIKIIQNKTTWCK
jgi:gamma-glutamyl-gamma-aminobutyrate hydrolase PuuD